MDDAEILSLMDEDVHGSLDAVKRVYNANYTQANGIEIDHISAGEVRLRMPIRDDHMNGNNVAHGGAVYAIIDDTFAFASNLFEPAVGQNTVVSFHRPAVGGVLESVSKTISDTRSLSVFEITVFCSGKHIATAMCTAFKTDSRRASLVR